MTALDAYRDELRELDKFESPTFTLKDFNYFMNNAVSKYISQNYKRLDVLQKDSDDLKSIIKMATPITLNASGLGALPPDYQHLLNFKVDVKFKVNIGKYRKDQVISFYPKRMKSGQKGFIYENSFTRPAYNRYYYEISGTSIQLLLDSSKVELVTTSANSWIDFVSLPAEVFIDPTPGADYNDPAKNTVLFYNTGTVRNHVYYELLLKCRELFLENIESPRFIAALQQSAQS